MASVLAAYSLDVKGSVKCFIYVASRSYSILILPWKARDVRRHIRSIGDSLDPINIPALFVFIKGVHLFMFPVTVEHPPTILSPAAIPFSMLVNYTELKEREV